MPVGAELDRDLVGLGIRAADLPRGGGVLDGRRCRPRDGARSRSRGGTRARREVAADARSLSVAIASVKGVAKSY